LALAALLLPLLLLLAVDLLAGGCVAKSEAAKTKAYTQQQSGRAAG
jgi:hypothetical protein